MDRLPKDRCPICGVGMNERLIERLRDKKITWFRCGNCREEIHDVEQLITEDDDYAWVQ